MGDAFGAGVNKVIKTGIGHVTLCIVNVFNVSFPPPK